MAVVTIKYRGGDRLSGDRVSQVVLVTVYLSDPGSTNLLLNMLTGDHEKPLLSPPLHALLVTGIMETHLQHQLGHSRPKHPTRAPK